MLDAEIDILRLERDEDFVRFEFAKESPWGTMHNSLGEALTLHVDDARERVKLLLDAGWKVAPRPDPESARPVSWSLLLQDVFG